MNDNVAAPENTGEAAPLNNVESTASTTDTTPEAKAPELTADQVAKFLGTNTETLEAYQKFVSNNGGWDKSLSAYRKAIASRTPAADATNHDAQVQAPAAAEPPVAPAQPQPIKGGMSTEEFILQQYFESLSKVEEYKGIAQQVRSGEVLKEMTKFGIKPMVNGQFNDTQVREFLTLYAKSMPAPEPAAPVTNTPTVEFVQVGEAITNMNEAMQVLAQDRELRAQGLAGHPRAKEANEFFDNTLNANQNRGRVEHHTLDQK